MIVVTLPFPDSRLSPNRSKGVHWAATSALRKKARTDAHLLTLQALGGNKWADSMASLTITFIQPDRRQRDRDNLLAASKPALDGIADALGLNDAHFDPIIIRREYGTKPGSVRVEIGAATVGGGK